jgi:hypothetical protein
VVRVGGAGRGRGVAVRAGSCGSETGGGGSDSFGSTSRGGGVGISSGGTSSTVFAFVRVHAVPLMTTSIATESKEHPRSTRHTLPGRVPHVIPPPPS